MKKIIIPKEIIEQYINQGKCRSEISKDLGISTDTLKRLLKDYDLIIPSYGWGKGKEKSNRQYPEINKEWLINHWLNTPKSIKELADELHISDSLLESRIAFYKLKKPTKYLVNKEKLFNLNDPQVYYLAGLIATDGYLPKDSDSFDIELTGSLDAELLKNLLEYFESNSKVFNYGKRNLLTITCPGIQDFLINNFGITKENKTFTVKTPTNFLNDLYAKAYILGCIDGDGYINKNGKKIALTTASEPFVKELKNIILLYSGIEFKYYIEKRKSGNYPSIQLAGSKQVYKFLTWLYSDNIICLKRKKDIYLSLYKQEEGDLNEVNKN